MDSVETTIRFAESMTYNGKKSIVDLTKKLYETGVKVGEKAILEKWFLTISPGYYG